MPTMIRAIIFDCFGVLITDALGLMCEELAVRDPRAAGEVHGLIRAGNAGIMPAADTSTAIAKLLGLSEADYRERLRNGEVRDHRLLDYVLELKATYKIGLLTNMGGGSLAKRFSPDEQTEYFDAVAASGDIGVAKPERAAYEYIANKLGVTPEECVFVDDREEFCHAAVTANMQAILYHNFAEFRRDLESLLSNTQD